MKVHMISRMYFYQTQYIEHDVILFFNFVRMVVGFAGHYLKCYQSPIAAVPYALNYSIFMRSLSSKSHGVRREIKFCEYLSLLNFKTYKP